MHEKRIRCPECGKLYPLSSRIFRCECRGNLEIIFDYHKLKKVDFSSRPFNQMRYKEFYPVKTLVSLKEGGTPLLKSRNIKLPGIELFFKLDSLNPTGSFKDRGSSVEVAKALELNATRVVCASTGNMGASVAAYSGAANLESFILTPRSAKKVKLEQMLAYGSRVYHLSGSYSQAASLAESLKGYFLLGDYLYRREGTKSIGFELAEQGSFDYVFCPVGNGILASSCWKGFREFKLTRRTKKLPKLAGIQASGCAPVVRAFKSRSAIKPIRRPNTLAKAIECESPLDGSNSLSAIKDSDGFAESVTDSEILRARDLLARKEGIFAEPAGAASLAGLLKSAHRLPRSSQVVCLITGHGLKAPFTGVSGKPINSGVSSALKSLSRNHPSKSL